MGSAKVDPRLRLEAALARLPAGAAFTGLTALWLNGLDVAPCDPIHVAVPPDAGVSARSGMLLRRATLEPSEIVCVRGMPTTGVVRAIAEAGTRLSDVEVVVVADAALHNRRTTVDQIVRWTAKNRWRRGVRRLRQVARDVDPASESPMETRLRMVLVLGGLPRPKAQVAIHDRDGRFAGRVDLFYEDARLAIEYDGVAHRESLVEDNRRQNALLRAGVTLLRFTAADVLGRPEAVVREVREVLNATSAGRRFTDGARRRTSAGKR